MRITQPHPVVEELRRIATEQVDRALDDLDDDRLDPHATVHEVRKRCKKVRGLARLVRGAFPGYREVNAVFRDAAKPLSGVRDAEANLEAWDALMTRYGAGLDPDLRSTVRGRLEAHRRRIAAEQDLGEALERFAETMRSARAAIAGWSLEADGFEAIEGGLVKTYRRGRERMREAAVEPDGELLHEWRKRVKYHWYHLRLLGASWPRMIEARAETAKRLADLLGDHHDLENLERTLAAEPEAIGGEQALRVAAALIAHRRSSLCARAQLLGERHFSERPEQLRERFGGYWQAWVREREVVARV